MPHRIDGRKLGRQGGARTSLYRNLAVSVLRYERVKTTEAKAKEIRGEVERMITLAKRGDLAARRSVVADLPNEPLVVNKLFDEIAAKYADRQSGFTGGGRADPPEGAARRQQALRRDRREVRGPPVGLHEDRSARAATRRRRRDRSDRTGLMVAEPV